VGLRAGLDGWGGRENLLPPLGLEPQMVQPTASFYIGFVPLSPHNEPYIAFFVQRP
jgi:hypothetical protein